MEYNKEGAFRAKKTAERRFAERDFGGAKKYAVKAYNLYPGLEGISQMLATFDVYVASEIQINGETDFYSILGLNPLADEDIVRKQYRKLALLLHPDKNKTVGAEGAFKLVSEAWTLLSDGVKRSSYDLRRNKQPSAKVVDTDFSVAQNPGVNGSNNCYKSSNSHNQSKPPTFWTVCSSCKVQYEYLRKYLNNRLSCKNCRRTFVAVETGKAPANGSIPYCSWSFSPEIVHGGHGFGGVTYFPANTIFFTGSGVAGFHSGFGYEFPNMAFQWSPFPGTSAGVVGGHGSNTTSVGVHQANNNVKVDGEKVKAAAKDKDLIKNAMGTMASKMSSGDAKPPISKSQRPEKRRKVDEGTFRNGHEEKGLKSVISEMKLANGDINVGHDNKSCASEAPIRRSSVAPAFDARQLLINKARTEIRKKLEEIKLEEATAAAAEQNPKVQTIIDNSGEPPIKADLGDPVGQSQSNKPGLICISVPDPDFHNFDKERSEECFKPKQIWAMYDEDGMPRLYCLIRQVLSVKPFKIRISYLNSKSNSEFGSVNWIDSGFIKSCGNFRTWSSDIIELVNVFSHVLHGAKAGRGGCIQIFPKKGDIWAVYRNWSPDWNRATPDEVRHQYEMVEVLDDYTEKLGICVTPLAKLNGFKTVYEKNMDRNAIRWIPRREMLRFSHQVPSWLLKGERSSLPEGCWDLDPAATPEELLQAVTGASADDKPDPAK